MSIPAKIREEHYQLNKDWWEKEGHILSEPFDGYLEEQPKMIPIHFGVHRPMLSKWFLDNRQLTGRENVCEVMGVYNVLWALHREVKEGFSFPDLLNYFEKSGIWMSGYFGTWPWSLIRFFKKNGYGVKVLLGPWITKERIQKYSSEGAFLMMTMNNKKTIWDMVHTMCISKEQNGYRLHNDYEGNRLYPSVEEAVFGYHGGKGKPLLFLRVNTK